MAKTRCLQRTVKIDDITIRPRIRTELGDLTPLIASMGRFGLLQPILVNRDFQLIKGGRRLAAAKRLGWQAIEIRVIEPANDNDLPAPRSDRPRNAGGVEVNAPRPAGDPVENFHEVSRRRGLKRRRHGRHRAGNK